MGCRLHGWKGINSSSLFFCGCDEGVSVWDRFFLSWFGTSHASHIFMCFRLYGFFFSFVSGIFLSGGGGRGGWGLRNEETDSAKPHLMYAK